MQHFIVMFTCFDFRPFLQVFSKNQFGILMSPDVDILIALKKTPGQMSDFFVFAVCLL